MDAPSLLIERLRLRRLALGLLLPLALAACAGGNAVRADAAPTADTALVGAAEASAAPAADDPGFAATQASTGVADAGATSQDTTVAIADAPVAPPPAGDAPTQAEQDFAAIYGGAVEAPYDPVADPTLPAPAQLPSSYDPWEPLNRKVFAFNNVVDRVIARPLARFYIAVTPRPVRLGVGNFFNNLGQPVSAVNALLQGRPKQAGQSLGRFAVNSTLGLAGIFDPATRFGIPNRSEDFGQTLGVWGWKQSRFLELPLFGPRTVRDAFGLIGDSPLAPLQYVEDDKARVFLQGLQLVDVRTQLMAVDSMREGAIDAYALTRDAWLQRRNYQIFQDSQRSREGDDSLPDYLQEGTDPYVPVDVMPVVPGSPGG